jgi:pimeloyl-ACP methyl ester carboxylesterase
MDTLLPGITAGRLRTTRLTVAVLSIADRSGQAVLFAHGNVSSSLFWQPTMLALPGPYRPLAIDMRGFGDSDPEPARIGDDHYPGTSRPADACPSHRRLTV